MYFLSKPTIIIAVVKNVLFILMFCKNTLLEVILQIKY